MVEFFLSFKNFKSHKSRVLFQWPRFIKFSYDATNFLEQHFLCQFPLNFFDYNNILISMKKDVEHISVNTVRATFLLHK